VQHTTGLSVRQFAQLTQWITQSEPLHSVPAVLGVVGSLRATLIYLRHNLPQAAIGELLGVSQPTVSRAVKALTELVTRALDGYLVTAEEATYALDGTLLPCWSWKDRTDLWSGKHKRTGLSLQVLVSPAGRLRWASDPLPGATHGTKAITTSGLLEEIDPSCCIADKGYIGTGVLTPYKKPPNSELTKAQKQANKSLNEIRYVVERTIAHIKSWKILAHDYRRPLHTFKETITATLALYAYTNP